jgi:hypothetical protein
MSPIFISPSWVSIVSRCVLLAPANVSSIPTNSASSISPNFPLYRTRLYRTRTES